MKKNKKLIFLLMLTFSCKSGSFSKDDNHIFIQKEQSESSEWNLVWQDDFSGHRIDRRKWTKIPSNKADWGKHMSDAEDCYHISDGYLYLRGIVNPNKLKDKREFLTGGIYSKGKFAFQYGKLEVRAKLESAQGSWPAIWLLAEKNIYGDYPKNGEIDVMEHLNFDDKVYQSVHSYSTLEPDNTENPPNTTTSRFVTDSFNVFGLEWYPDKLIFSINGEETFVYRKNMDETGLQWPFDQPFYILIDQQLGGKWVGKVNAEDLPVNMIVDYVKVYQK